MDKLRAGIIGLGRIARQHCEAIATLDNVDLVAVADLEEENRQKYVRQYDIPKAYPHHTALLEDDSIDAVAVVLGHQLHHQLVVDACNAGKHVLVEKPMAPASMDSRRTEHMLATSSSVAPASSMSSCQTGLRANSRISL